MNTVNELKKVLDSKRPLDPVTTKSLQDDFMLRYNQASNAIEGNQLTLIETRVLLENGITAKGKPFKDHLDVINHREAINYLLDIVKAKESLKAIDVDELILLIRNLTPLMSIFACVILLLSNPSLRYPKNIFEIEVLKKLYGKAQENNNC